MQEYGYIENGYLRSRIIKQIEQKGYDDSGNLQTKIITEEEQIAALSSKWKPVDTIDTSRIDGAEDGFVVIPVPFDAGDHIGYNYVKKRDTLAVQVQIKELKDSLSDSDYKITKCYEASLVGTELPYDVVALHTERQAIRDQINALEATL